MPFHGDHALKIAGTGDAVSAWVTCTPQYNIRIAAAVRTDTEPIYPAHHDTREVEGTRNTTVALGYPYCARFLDDSTDPDRVMLFDVTDMSSITRTSSIALQADNEANLSAVHIAGGNLYTIMPTGSTGAGQFTLRAYSITEPLGLSYQGALTFGTGSATETSNDIYQAQQQSCVVRDGVLYALLPVYTDTHMIFYAFAINVANLATMSKIGHVAASSRTLDAGQAPYTGSVSIKDGVLAAHTIYSGGEKLALINITDPASMSSYSDTSGYGIHAMSGDYVYAWTGSTIAVLDISDPSSPSVETTVGGAGTPNWCGSWGMAIYGKYLYNAGLDGTSYGTVSVWDLTDPSAPTRAGTASDLPYYLWGLHAAGGYLISARASATDALRGIMSIALHDVPCKLDVQLQDAAGNLIDTLTGYDSTRHSPKPQPTYQVVSRTIPAHQINTSAAKMRVKVLSSASGGTNVWWDAVSAYQGT